MEPLQRRPLFDRKFTILLALQLLVIVGLGWVLIGPPMNPPNALPRIYRDLASELQASGMAQEALPFLERYFESAPDAEKASVAFSLSQMYLAEDQLGKALGWSMAVKVADQKSPHSEEAAKQTVVLLEKLGKVAAAKRVLKSATSLAGDPPSNDPKGSVVLAQVGTKSIFSHDLDGAIDELPKEMKDKVATKEGKAEILKKLVADEVLAAKAFRLGLDQDPKVAKKLAQIRQQILIQKIIEDDILKKITVDPSDLKNFFESHKERYAKTDSKGKTSSPATFEAVRTEVEKDYRMAKLQERYQELLTESLAGDEVKLFADRIK